MTDLPPLEFILTPQERDQAAAAAVQIEHHRRSQCERDRTLALAQWRGDQSRYPTPSPERRAYVERLRAQLDVPMTHAERVHLACQKAAVAAEDDRRRQPVPQLQFPEAA